MTESVDLDFSIEEDDLVQSLLNAKGRKVEFIAFGIMYSGILESVDIDNGTVIVRDGEDRAMIEIERIEALSISMP